MLRAAHTLCTLAPELAQPGYSDHDGTPPSTAGLLRPWEKTFGRILTPFEEFIHQETAGGIVLIVSTVIALILANSPLADSYKNVLDVYITLGLGSWDLGHSLQEWINDGLMALFFFVFGLVAGKLIGITGVSIIAAKMRLGQLPADCREVHIAGAGLLAGIGFTKSIFIAELAFRSQSHQLVNAKTAILFASLFAGAAHYAWLRKFGKAA